MAGNRSEQRKEGSRKMGMQDQDEEGPYEGARERKKWLAKIGLLIFALLAAMVLVTVALFK